MVKVGSRLESDSGRLYETESGPAPSVTSVLGAWPSPWLVDWKIKNIARKVIDGDKKLKKAVKRASNMNGTLIGERVASATLEKLMLEMSEDTTRADRGTRIHEGVERIINGEKRKAVRGDMIPEEMIQVEKIIGEIQRLDIEVLEIEAVVTGTQPGPYAGTLDMLGEIKTEIRGKTRRSCCVVDLKTGRESTTWSAQLYAYGHSDRVVSRSGSIIDMPHVHRGLVIQTVDGGVKTLEADFKHGKLVWDICYAMFHLSNQTYRKLEKV